MPFFSEMEKPKRPSDEVRSRFVALVSCGKAKLDRPAEAKDLYTGGLTKKQIDWAERNCSDWFILSAKFGLLRPDREIGPYDMKVSDFSKKEKSEWGDKVYLQMEKRNLLWRRILLLTGREYRDAIPWGEEVRRYSLFPDSMKMGPRLAWLKKHPLLNDEIERMITEP